MFGGKLVEEKVGDGCPVRGGDVAFKVGAKKGNARHDSTWGAEATLRGTQWCRRGKKLQITAENIKPHNHGLPIPTGA